MSSHSSLNHTFRTVWNQSLGAMVAVAEIASGRGRSAAGGGVSGVGGASRVAALPLCIALAWGAVAPGALANPTGGVAVVGQATMVTTGNKLLVTTQNGAGANHSAINWQSFSIPQGNTTHFQQPSAASTVINRVVTHTPSQIFGTLSSNGHLVLVNQAGIAVGAGAVVDTAGFTASALRMTDADALAARMRFGDGTASGAGVSVNGSVLARSGDVVLLGGSVTTGADALIQSPNGSTILAAGQQVELTGRGLEGIRLQVQAPADAVVNLGTLKGDAVGIFAGTLKHSGVIQATTATMQGGKVVLKAVGDAYVEGAGKILATGGVGQTGGSVDVLGNRVAVMDQAQIDVSGAQGGGTVRVGGDYQGKNAAVPNANVTHFGSEASIKADALDSGNGGKVIVWADDTTRAHGIISAKGGANGGDGGFVETSGKIRLDATRAPDMSAPNGKGGQWLLDPSDLTVVAGLAGSINLTGISPFSTIADNTPSRISADIINAALGLGNVEISTTAYGGKITFDGNPLTTGALLIRPTNPTGPSTFTATAGADGIEIRGGSSTFGGDVTFESTPSYGFNVYLNPSAGNNVFIDSTANLTFRGYAGGPLVAAIQSGVNDTQRWDNRGKVNLEGNSLINLKAGGFRTGFKNNADVVNPNLNINTTNTWSFLSDFANQDGRIDNESIINVNVNTSWEARFNQTSTGTLNVLATKVLSMQNPDAIAGAVSVGSGATLKLSERHVTLTPSMAGANISGAGSIDVNSSLGVVSFTGASLSGGARIGNEFGSFTVPSGLTFGTGGAGFYSGNGTLTVASAVTTGNNNLTLTANGVAINSAISTGTGNLNITSTGAVTQTAAITTGGGNVSLTATGAIAADGIITGGGNVTLSGTEVSGVVIDTKIPTVGGNGGAVSITATAGDVLGQTIQTFGVAGSTNTYGSGGNVTVTATGDIEITGNQINTDADVVAANTLGQAGSVTLTSSGGSVTVGPVFSRGTQSQPLQLRNGGAVNISASGTVTALDVIQTQGVIGGNITLSGGSGVNFQGELNTSSGAAANGSTVTLSAGSGSVSDLNSTHTGRVISDVLTISANGVELENITNNVANLNITPTGTSPISYWDADSFSLGALTFGALSLSLKSNNGNITQTGALIANDVNSVTTIQGVGMTLEEPLNNFAKLAVSGSTGDVSIRDANAVNIVSASTAGAFNLVAGDNITVLAGAGGIATSSHVALTAQGTNKLLTVTGPVSSSTGNVTYVADNVSLTGTTSSGAGNIEIKPFTAATVIEFEATATPDSPGFLRLSSTELATLTTPLLKVGNISNIGGIQFKQPVTLSAVEAMSLITSASIGQDASATVQIPNLNAHGMAGVTLNEANYVSGSLAGRTGTGAFSFSNGTDNIDVGPVDIVNNGIISDGGGAISLATTLGSIATTGTGIIKTAGALTANSYAGMNLKTEVGTLNATNSGSSGDVVVSNAGANAPVLTLGTLSLGAGSGRWLIYVDDPSKLVKAGNTSSFRRYVKTIGVFNSDDPQWVPTGNGFVYASTPGQLQVDTILASGTASNTFGVNPTATFGYTIANSSIADNEDFALSTGTPVFTPVITSATNAGRYSITYESGKSNPAGYTFAAGTGLPYTVNAAPVSVNTVSLSGTRPYDGTDVVNGSIFSISGLVGSDTLVLSGSGTVADKNVGVNKPVTLGTLALANGIGLASNYTLSGGTYVATITKAPITGVTGITATNRPYDGTLVAALTTSGAVFAGMVADDNLSVTSSKGAFKDKNVGDGKAVTVSDVVFGGADVGNYSFGVAPVSPLKANITLRSLSTWIGPASGGNWSTAANWDALPDASNVAAVALPSGGVVVYDAAVGSTDLQSVSGGGTLDIAGGSLTVASSVSLQGYQQTAGTLATAGAFTVTNSFSQTGGTVVAGGAVAITQASGDLTVGSITAPSISLKANGSISQTNGLVTAGLLSTQSGGGTVLNNAANRVSAFQAASTGAGDIEFTNVGALDVRGLRTASGSIKVSNTGGISTSGPVVARGGKITGVANSPLTIGPDGVSADGDISLIATNLTSAGNITLNGPVVSSGGAIAVTAAANLTQNSTVSAALGVTAEAGGTTVFGPAASTVGSPVNYANSGVPTPVPETPKTVVQEQFIQVTQSRVTVDLVETFSAKFEQAVAAQEEAKAPPGSPLRKKKEEENTVVAEAPICPR